LRSTLPACRVIPSAFVPPSGKRSRPPW
jgi:hypothetical protein